MWAGQAGTFDRVVTSLAPDEVCRGDVVFGTLPIAIAAAVIARGARYVHLTLDVPPALRGRELSQTEMDALGARLEEHHVERRPGEYDVLLHPQISQRPAAMVVINSGETLGNLVPVLYVRPSRLVVLDTGAFSRQLNWLTNACKLALHELTIETMTIPDTAADLLDAIERPLQTLSQSCRLISNVTGGLKPISIALHEATRRLGGEIIYFDVAKNRIETLFPLRPPVVLPPILTMADWFAAHGYSKATFGSGRDTWTSFLAHTQRLVEMACRARPATGAFPMQLRLLNRVTHDRAKSPENATMALEDGPLLEFLRDLKAVDGTPPKFLLGPRHALFELLAGKWLEYWVYTCLHATNICQSIECAVDLHSDAQPNTVESDIDVAALQLNQPILIECKCANPNDRQAGGGRVVDWISILASKAARIGGARAKKVIVSVGNCLDESSNSSRATNIRELLAKEAVFLIQGAGVLNRELLVHALTSALNSTKPSIQTLLIGRQQRPSPYAETPGAMALALARAQNQKSPPSS